MRLAREPGFHHAWTYQLRLLGIEELVNGHQRYFQAAASSPETLVTIIMRVESIVLERVVPCDVKSRPMTIFFLLR
jgi:hypothetical protein